MLNRKEKKQVAPYSILANIYDQVMSHVNYELWANYIAKIAKRNLMNVENVLDISCGTGNLCDFLERYGYSVMGCDSSSKMVKTAQEMHDNSILFWCADMKRPSLHKKVNIVVSLYDSMNYLLDDKDWVECFENVYDILQKDGLFIFDVSTLYNSIYIFKNYVQREEFYNASYYRKSYFKKDDQIQINYFEIQLNEFPQTIFCETHQQRIRSLENVKSLIDDTNFSLVGCYRNFTFQPAVEKSERIHLVLKKE